MKNSQKINVRTDQNGLIKSFNEKEMLHNKNGPAVVSPDGSEEWFLNGVRHRDGGPAVKQWDGAKQGFVYRWYVNGKLHRIDGPAIVEEIGARCSKEWFENNERHRSEVDADGNALPAIEKFVNGDCISKEWWKNGGPHRENDLPAVEIFKNGKVSRQWWKDGLCHRESKGTDGRLLPAIENEDGTKEWWLNGVRNREECDEKGRVLPALEKSDGTREWWIGGERHREDRDEDGHVLPAVEQPNVFVKEWWKNGKLHRDGGFPAVVYSDGAEWWVDGKRHRLNGPAIEDGLCGYWYLNGKKIEKEEHPFWKAKEEEKMLEIEIEPVDAKGTSKQVKKRM